MYELQTTSCKIMCVYIIFILFLYYLTQLFSRQTTTRVLLHSQRRYRTSKSYGIVANVLYIIVSRTLLIKRMKYAFCGCRFVSSCLHLLIPQATARHSFAFYRVQTGRSGFAVQRVPFTPSPPSEFEGVCVIIKRRPLQNTLVRNSLVCAQMRYF